MMSVAKPAQLTCLAVGSELPETPAKASGIAALTARLHKGEDAAYREFYDAYARRIYGYLFVLCRGDESQAREILQQTLIKVARYVRVFEDEEIFWKWLTNLARSAWIDEGRKRNRYLAALERLWNWTSGNQRAEFSCETEFIELLPEEDRTLLTQKYIEGLSVREIAEASGISEKAVESRLLRARNKIKETIKLRNT